MTAREPLEIAYLFEDTPLFGGVKIVLRQANLMARRGHRVTVVSPGEPPTWFPLEARFLRTTGLAPEEIPTADVTIATYWTTIGSAIAGAKREVAHYCQGYEAIYTHNQDQHSAIRQAYSAPIPALALSPHLGRLVRETYGRPVRVVPQALAPEWAPDARQQPSEPPRILVTSPFEIDWKGVPTSLMALRLLRDRGFPFRLIRLSQWPQCEAERAVLEADEFHEHLPPSEVHALVRGCDLQLAPSWEQEGFGMPVLEAMASGVPVVASEISSFKDFAASAARLVPFDRPAAFADAAQEVLSNPDQWRAMRAAGLVVAEGFEEQRVADQAEEALYWLATGAWRGDS